MSYNIERYLKTLELDKILELLANETTIADSAEFARNILPEKSQRPTNWLKGWKVK